MGARPETVVDRIHSRCKGPEVETCSALRNRESQYGASLELQERGGAGIEMSPTGVQGRAGQPPEESQLPTTGSYWRVLSRGKTAVNLHF